MNPTTAPRTSNGIMNCNLNASTSFAQSFVPDNIPQMPVLLYTSSPARLAVHLMSIDVRGAATQLMCRRGLPCRTREDQAAVGDVEYGVVEALRRFGRKTIVVTRHEVI